MTGNKFSDLKLLWFSLTTKEVMTFWKKLLQIKWIAHVHRTHRARLWPAVMKYQPAKYRNTGHLLKRLVDCDVETRGATSARSLKA